MGSMDADANPVTPAKYRVTGLPTMNLYYKGEVVRSLVGVRPKSAILSELERAHAFGGGVRWDVIAADAGVAQVDLGYHLRCLRDRGLVRGVREFSLNGRTLYEATATISGRGAIQG